MDDYAEEEIVENPTLRAAYNLAPLHQNLPLRWDYEVRLIGEKIYDKMIHLCEICELPILVYGRLLPCKHIFCFDCALKCDTKCMRCNNKVGKVEKSALGTVYVCTHGAPKHSTKGCRRTYLSQRDLQAHIAHRHMPKASSNPTPGPTPVQPLPSQLPLTKQQAAQQAAQKQMATQEPCHITSVQSHIPPPVLPPIQSPLGLPFPTVQHTLQPLMSIQGLTHVHQQPTGLPVGVQQMSPALGDLRPVGQPVINQNPPLMQPPVNPPHLSRGLGLPYSVPSQVSPEMFHTMDIRQSQQQSQPPGQQMMAMPGSHLQPGQGQPGSHLQPGQGQPGSHLQPGQGQPGSHLQPSQGHQTLQQYSQQRPQFPGSAGLMPPSQLTSAGTVPLSSDSFPQHPHLSTQPAPQLMDSYGDAHSLSSANQMSQTRNVNLITVPIQDEGQYRPVPFVLSSLGPHSNSPFPQPRPNLSSQSQAYPQSTQPTLTSSTYSSANSFSQNVGQPQNLPNPNSSQNLPFSQSNMLRVNSPGMMINQRVGMGNTQLPDMGRTLTGVVRGGIRTPVGSGPGLMPTPGTPPAPVGQGGVNRFPPAGHWGNNQRMIQPRLSQTQHRPHMDDQFNPGSGYYH